MKKYHRWEAGLLGCLLAVAAFCIWRGGHEVRQASKADTAVLLPVAMYHSVTDVGDSPGQYVISPSMLENDLNYLSEHGYTTVTVNDLIAYVMDGASLPEKPVMLTFDDGYYNNYCNAYPLLQKYDMRAVLSSVGALTEQFSQTDDLEEHEAWSYCTRAELKEMADSGVIEMQNHSYNFHTLDQRKGCLRKSGENTETYRAMFIDDTQQAQDLFTEIGIAKPICYTYPYGALNEETEELIGQCGFTASLSCEEGIASIVHDPACLRRIRRFNRDGRVTSEQFWGRVLKQMEEGDS